jgi:hypothetical protein
MVQVCRANTPRCAGLECEAVMAVGWWRVSLLLLLLLLLLSFVMHAFAMQ